MSNPSQVTFTLPTTNTDGTLLDPANETGVKINVLDSAGNVGFSTVVDKAHLNLDATGSGSVALPALPSGSYSVELFTEAVSQGVAVESPASAQVPFVVAQPSIPNPPTAVSVV